MSKTHHTLSFRCQKVLADLCQVQLAVETGCHPGCPLNGYHATPVSCRSAYLHMDTDSCYLKYACNKCISVISPWISHCDLGEACFWPQLLFSSIYIDRIWVTFEDSIGWRVQQSWAEHQWQEHKPPAHWVQQTTTEDFKWILHRPIF